MSKLLSDNMFQSYESRKIDAKRVQIETICNLNIKCMHNFTNEYPPVLKAIGNVLAEEFVLCVSSEPIFLMLYMLKRATFRHLRLVLNENAAYFK